MPKPREREIYDAYKAFKASSLNAFLRMGMTYDQANDFSDDIAGEAITRILEKVKKSDEIENITHYGLTVAPEPFDGFFRKKGARTSLNWLYLEKAIMQQSWITGLWGEPKRLAKAVSPIIQ